MKTQDSTVLNVTAAAISLVETLIQSHEYISMKYISITNFSI